MRDLYAIVQFYTSHPDHPLPWSITLHHAVDTDAEVDAVAAAYAGRAAYGEPGTSYQSDHYLRGTSTAVGFTVSHRGGDRRPL